MFSGRAFLFAFVFAFCAGLLASLALRTPGAPITAEDAAQRNESVVRWRVPTAFGTNLPALGDNILYVSEALARASQDSGADAPRIELKPFEPGELVPAFSITDAVREGKLQAGYTWLGYDSGKLPSSVLFSAIPFGPEPWEFMAWWYEGGGQQLAEEIYGEYGVHPILCGLIGPETAGWFRFPLKSLDDVQGLKIRFAGLGGKVLERLGASVTMLPGGEIFQALEKGAIDATEYSLPVVDQKLGFDRVARNNLFPGWHQTFTAMHLVVNPAAWAALSLRQQAQIENACTAGVTRNLARSEALQGAVIKKFQADAVNAQRLPDDLLRALATETAVVLAEEAASNADFARVLSAQQAFMEEASIWRRLAYLPRDFATGEAPDNDTGNTTR